MTELKPMQNKEYQELRNCPFCGGKAKVSLKDYRFCGYSDRGDRKICYRVQVICNKCRSRGRPIITEPLLNPLPCFSKWGNIYNPEFAKCREQTELFEPYVNKAIEAWNRRAGDTE